MNPALFADAKRIAERTGGKIGGLPRTEWAVPEPAREVHCAKVYTSITLGKLRLVDICADTRLCKTSVHGALQSLLEQGKITAKRAGQGGNGLMLEYRVKA